MDIWDYFERHQRECRSLGLVESDNFPIQYFAMEGCNDMRGLILGRYDLGDRAFVGVKEIVEIVEGNYPQRSSTRITSSLTGSRNSPASVTRHTTLPFTGTVVAIDGSLPNRLRSSDS